MMFNLQGDYSREITSIIILYIRQEIQFRIASKYGYFSQMLRKSEIKLV